MANIVNVRNIEQGPRNAIFHIYLESDGATGELEDEVIIDPATIGLLSTDRLVLQKITFGLSGFDARIEFDTGVVEDKMIWVLTPGNSFVDFTSFGGLKDFSGLDGTAKVQITTTGFTSLGDQGSIVLEMKK